MSLKLKILSAILKVPVQELELIEELMSAIRSWVLKCESVKDYWNWRWEYHISIRKEWHLDLLNFYSDLINSVSYPSHSLPISKNWINVLCEKIVSHLVEIRKKREEQIERERLIRKEKELEEQKNRQAEFLMELRWVKKDEGIAKISAISEEILNKGKEIDNLRKEVERLRKEWVKLINK